MTRRLSLVKLFLIRWFGGGEKKVEETNGENKVEETNGERCKVS